MTPFMAIAITSDSGAACVAPVRRLSFLLRSHPPHPVNQPAPGAAWAAARGRTA
jgi:hypothetical protein